MTHHLSICLELYISVSIIATSLDVTGIMVGKGDPWISLFQLFSGKWAIFPTHFNAPSFSESQQGNLRFPEDRTTLSPWSLTAEFVMALGFVSQLSDLMQVDDGGFLSDKWLYYMTSLHYIQIYLTDAYCIWCMGLYITLFITYIYIQS